MLKALFISSQEDLHLLSTLVLNQSREQFYIFPARSVSESIDLIEEQGSFDLIFLGHRVKKDKELKDLSSEIIRHYK